MLKTSFKSKKGTALNQSKFFLTLRKTFFYKRRNTNRIKRKKYREGKGGILYCRGRKLNGATDSRKEKVKEVIVRV